MAQACYDSRRRLRRWCAGRDTVRDITFCAGRHIVAVVTYSTQDVARACSLARWGTLAGFMVGGFLFQMVAIAQLTPAVSAFLTSLYVVFTALFLAGWYRRLQSAPLLGGALLATIGAGWMQGPPQLHFNWPEWLTVISALMFAGHIIATDVVTRRVSPIGVMFSSIVLAALASLLLLNLQLFVQPIAVAGLLGDPDFLVPLLLSAFFGTFIALMLVNLCQKLLDPVRAAILYALEPVWATLLAITYGLATVNSWLLLGGGALLLGNLIAELAPQRDSE